MANSRQYNIVIKWNIFFFSKLDSRRCFRCLNSINFNKAETKLTSAGHHNTAAYAALSAGAGATAARHARRTLPATARHLPASWKVKAIQTLAFFHGWLVNWGTTPSNARAHADAGRRERQWFQLCLFYGMVLVVEIPWEEVGSPTFFLVNEKTNSFG